MHNPLQFDTLPDFLYAILNIAIVIMFPIVVLMIVYTGYLFLAAQGNPNKLEEAKRALLWTVIGGLIVLGSYALALGIQATVNSLTASSSSAPITTPVVV